MKVDLLETHDRLKEFNSGWQAVSQGVQDCIDNVPDEIKMQFYVFGHTRQIGIDERFNLYFQGHWQDIKDVPSERIIWMPRATKPLAEPNTYLFRTRKGTDLVDINWILPKKELWDQYSPDKMTHNDVIWTAIQNYKHYRAEMEYESDPLSIEQINEFKRIIRSVAYFQQKDVPWKLIT